MDVNKTEIAQYVLQMQNGDGQAFEKLYNATNQSGYFTALKILKDEDEAQDVLQDSYITVLEKIGDIQNPESFVSWFHQIVANKAKNYLAKKKPSLFVSDEEEQDYAEFTPDEDEIWQPEKNVDEDDVRQQVMQIIDGLSDEKRTCVLLYYYNEMSVADIASSVGASENTVKARLFQARKDIRKAVEKLEQKNISLRGVAPVSLVVWALRLASKSDGAKFAAGPAAAVVLKGAAAAASSGAAAAGTAAVTSGAAAATTSGAAAATTSGAAAAVTAAGAVAAETAAVGAAQAAVTAGGGLVAKIAAMSIAQKVVAGVVAAGVVTGAATGTAAVVETIQEEPKAEPRTEAVEAYAGVTAADVLNEMAAFPRVEKATEREEQAANGPTLEPTATTAASAEGQTTAPSGPVSLATTSVAAHGEEAPVVTAGQSAAPAETSAAKPMTTATTTTTKPTTTTTTTTKPTTTTTTTKPTTTTTAKPTTTTTTTTKPTTTTATTKPTTTTTTKPTTTTTTTTKPTTTTTTAADHTPQVITTTTTEKVKGTATVNVGYSVADYDDSGSVSFTVQEGDAITEDMVVNAVRGKLSGSYSIDDVILRSGSPVSSADATTYSYTVIVYVD